MHVMPAFTPAATVFQAVREVGFTGGHKGHPYDLVGMMIPFEDLHAVLLPA